jgi:hypothetical protein
MQAAVRTRRRLPCPLERNGHVHRSLSMHGSRTSHPAELTVFSTLTVGGRTASPSSFVACRHRKAMLRQFSFVLAADTAKHQGRNTGT